MACKHGVAPTSVRRLWLVRPCPECQAERAAAAELREAERPCPSCGGVLLPCACQLELFGRSLQDRILWLVEAALDNVADEEPGRARVEEVIRAMRELERLHRDAHRAGDVGAVVLARSQAVTLRDALDAAKAGA